MAVADTGEDEKDPFPAGTCIYRFTKSELRWGLGIRVRSKQQLILYES